MAIYYIIISSGAIVFASCLFYGAAQVSERVSMRLRNALFEALMRRDLSYFDQKENNIGALTVRLSDDSRTVSKVSTNSVLTQY